MTLQGDLSTLDLAGLLQNLETNRKCGVLHLETIAGAREVYFDKGQLSLVSYEGRPELMDVLVASGTISAQQLENAKKRRRRSGKSLGEVLVGARALSQEQLASIAQARLLDEACELVSVESGEFKFSEGTIPRGTFDPEERKLALKLPAGPLLMESARRQDHWRLIRERVPSDSAHFVVVHPPRQPEDAAAAELQAALLEGLNGTSSVAEVMARFPHKRFEAYQLLAGLVEARVVREAAATDLAKLADQSAPFDEERARALIERGLEASPRNLELLCQKARIAETAGELEEAAEALKMVVHMLLENGEKEQARHELERLKKLAAADTSVWEKSFALALEEGRTEDAVLEGKRLADLYRGPGLLNKAREVLERLVEVEPDSWELVRELANVRAEGGDQKTAVRELERFGDVRLAEAEYPMAQRVFEEVLVLDPKRKSAKETLELIKSGEHERRRARMRRLKRLVATTLSVVALAIWLSYEGAARRAYVRTLQGIADQELIEQRRYEDAARRLEDVRYRYPWASTGWYDARVQIRDLRERVRVEVPVGDEGDGDGGVGGE